MSFEESVVLDKQGLLAPASARGWVAARVAGLPENRVQDALLIVSELVTNAVRHGRPRIVLRLHRDGAQLVIAVSDEGETLPSVPTVQPSVRRPTGRGLLIVAATATEWGVRQEPGRRGKTVWVRLAPAV